MKLETRHNAGTSLHAWNTSLRLAKVRAITCEELVPAQARMVVIAPHPDDEVLGCGGLLQLVARLQRPILLISVTAGGASHPGSARWSEHRLSIVRPQESAEALRRLGLPLNELKWLHAGLPDSAVAAHEDALRQLLLAHLRPGDEVFTTWRDDGHCDHEAVARASLAAAAQVGARVHEVPIWAWHWATPEDPRIPWERARKLHLDRWTQARKRHAIQAFASQIHPDAESGLAPVLAPQTLERLQQAFEVVFV